MISWFILGGTYLNLQRLYIYTRKAIDKYSMIAENDYIAIGISGGKDSLTLLYALAGLRNFYPKKFRLAAICVDLGLGIQNMDKIKELCISLDVPFHIVNTEIGNIVFDIRRESNPCALCSKMRKGALNKKAMELGCNKIAYAHHRDDIIDTMFLSMLYEGQFYTFPPVTHFDDTNLSVIRPLMYVYEADVIGFKNKYRLPVAKNPCPADGHTKREYVKNLVRQLNIDNAGVKKRLFNAIEHGNINDWNNSLNNNRR